MSFSSLGLSEPILRVTKEVGYLSPTPVQVKAIPAVLTGSDVMAVAQTGTGKTASFVLPLLQLLSGGPKVKPNHVRALVLTPTRELAIQVAAAVTTYGKYFSLKSSVVYGGVKINPQMMKLRSGTDILVATPGRLLDLFSQNAIKFYQVETLILDEADRMLGLGFANDIHKILTLLPQKRQNLLFSATFSDDIQTLTADLLKKPTMINISPQQLAATTVQQCAYAVDKEKKSALLSHLIRKKGWQNVLVFMRTKNGADNLVKKLVRDGISAEALHGDKSQAVRTRALNNFKSDKINVLVATDLAARGIDIDGLPLVVNFDLPKISENYVHRIGRTGRADSEGTAISLVCADEVKLLASIETLIGQTLFREIEPDFDPAHKVPLTRQMKQRPKKPKKPKKPKIRSTQKL